MIEILQGETLAFVLDGENLTKYQVRAALRPSGASFRRDCTCGNAVLVWDNIEIKENKENNENGSAVWALTTEQSENLPVGKYAVEVALRDIDTQQDIKDSTLAIIEVLQSYTR